MRPIGSRLHGMLDYPMGILLIASPVIFGFSDLQGAVIAVPVLIGILVIAQSLITDYELSLANLLPLGGHLAIDVMAGLVLVVSPFLFGFSDQGVNAWLPHVVFGLGLIGSGLLTRPVRDNPRIGRTVGTPNPADDEVRAQESGSAGETVVKDEKWPDGDQPGPDLVDVERSERRPTTTGE